MKIHIVRSKGDRNIFISFIEEFWPMKPKYQDYIMGRIEVAKLGEEYASEEIRFFTDRTEEFLKFRERWDFRYVTKERLEKIRNIITQKFYEEVKE
jgi:hypothetical protein